MMDAIIVSTFLAVGERWDGFFSMVGDKLGQGTAVGMALHNATGLSGGFLFALLVLNLDLFAIDTKRKGLLLGILVGLITIPVGCIPLAIWLGQPVLEVIAFSAMPHMVYGTILGLVVTYGVLHRQGASS